MKNFTNILEDYIFNNKLSLSKIKFLTGLIYLNMSILHKPPFDKILFNFGKKIILNEI